MNMGAFPNTIVQIRWLDYGLLLIKHLIGLVAYCNNEIDKYSVTITDKDGQNYRSDTKLKNKNLYT